ncbi:amino acid transporter [Fictibacillus sp. 23RED33]|nr:amino acid transporter [Fictibacillus sp. 23RED33]
MEHYGKIEGYPTKNLSKVNIQGLPLPIRMLGYFFIGTMSVGMITVFLLSLFK